MGRLADRIREAVNAGHYVFGIHADERIRERGIPAWQVIAAMSESALLLERQDASPNPTAEFEVSLPDGTPAKAVWAWLPAAGRAKLVTVHFFDR